MEVGRRVAGHIRVAFEVDDSRATAEQLAAAGATVIAEPTVTPWNSLNARLEAPAGLQLTLFTELGRGSALAERERVQARPGSHGEIERVRAGLREVRELVEIVVRDGDARQRLAVDGRRDRARGARRRRGDHVDARRDVAQQEVRALAGHDLLILDAPLPLELHVVDVRLARGARSRTACSACTVWL